jgi:hypothetical protein
LVRSIGVLLLPLAVIGAVALRHPAVESRATAGADASHMTADQRRATFRFVGVAPGDQEVVRAAVAASRPEARRLIAIVDGLVEIRVGPAGAGSLGVTRSRPGGFDVTLDLATVAQTIGERGIRRLVLHELGHVVDFALVPRDLAARLDAGIPTGWGCDDGQTGACAAPAERFAETFAKWATGDIGVDIYAGYKVPPPEPSLEAWGAPLATLATR